VIAADDRRVKAGVAGAQLETLRRERALILERQPAAQMHGAGRHIDYSRLAIKRK
jgi:hypothetical protein